MTNSEAIEWFKNSAFYHKDHTPFNMAISALERERQGHWIEVEKYADGKHKIKCSECGNYIFDRGHANSPNVKEKYKYCNYCGAKMSE